MQRGPKEEVGGEEIVFLIAVAGNANDVGAVDDGRGGPACMTYVLDHLQRMDSTSAFHSPQWGMTEQRFRMGNF